jgi:hypothetical protein
MKGSAGLQQEERRIDVMTDKPFPGGYPVVERSLLGPSLLWCDLTRRMLQRLAIGAMAAHARRIQTKSASIVLTRTDACQKGLFRNQSDL